MPCTVMSFVPLRGPRWRSQEGGRVFIRGGGAKGRPSLKNLVLPVVFLPSCPCCPPLVLLVHRSSSALLSLFSSSCPPRPSFLLSYYCRRRRSLVLLTSSSSLLFRSSVFSPRPMSVPPDVLPASPPLSCHCRLPHLSPLQRSRRPCEIIVRGWERSIRILIGLIIPSSQSPPY